MSMPSAMFSMMINHAWQGLLIALVLAGVLAARRQLGAETRHGLAFAALVAAALLPLAMLLPANDTLMSSVAHSLDRGGALVVSTTEPAAAASEPTAPELQPIVQLKDALFALRDAPGEDRDDRTLAAVAAAAKTVVAVTESVRSAAAPTAPEGDRSLQSTDVTTRAGTDEISASRAVRIDPGAFEPALAVLRAPATLWTLALVWLAGALMLLARVGLDIAAAERLRARATPVALPGPLAHLVGALDVRESDEAAGPMALGLVRTAVVLPRGFTAERSAQELLGLIEHERAHVIRSDVRLALVQRLLTALLWWSPAIHWISARVDEEREMACDEAAAHRVGDARAFARTLTEHAQSQLFWGWPRLAVGAARSRSLLGRRVRRLIEIAGGGVQRVRLASRASAGVLLAVIAAAAIATPRLDAQDRQGDREDAPRAEPAPRPAPAPRAPAAPRAPDAQEARSRADLARTEAEVEALEAEVEALEDEIEAAADRFGEAVEQLYGETLTAAERASASEEMETARREMAEASQQLRHAVMDLVRQEIGSEFAQGFDPAEIERIVESAVAATSWVSDFDWSFDFDYDPESFARFESFANVGDAPVSVVAGAGWGRQSPLMTAVGMGDLAMVETLIDAGADVNTTSRGSSPLTMAAANGEVDIVRRLIDAGADVNGPEGARLSPLSIAAHNGEQEILEMLIEGGADVNAPLAGGETILMSAIRSGDVDMVRLLIANGADVDGGPTGGE